MLHFAQVQLRNNDSSCKICTAIVKGILIRKIFNREAKPFFMAVAISSNKFIPKKDFSIAKGSFRNDAMCEKTKQPTNHPVYVDMFF
ncbi:hypothetical protein ASE92_11035 [Pedobacter sp. Leaf41]|nr:hypothetical protein ASE92_11035 [Pedobacter sp. Leaf41]